MPSYGSNDGYGQQRLGTRPSTRQSEIGARQRDSSAMANLLAETDIQRQPDGRSMTVRGSVAGRERSDQPVLTYDDTLRHAMGRQHMAAAEPAGMPANADQGQYLHHPSLQQPLNAMQVEKLQTRQMHARMHAQALRDEQQYHQQAIAERFTRKTTEEILREQQRAERAAREEQYDKANVARAKGEMENKRAANAEHQDQYQAMLERRRGGGGGPNGGGPHGSPIGEGMGGARGGQAQQMQMQQMQQQQMEMQQKEMQQRQQQQRQQHVNQINPVDERSGIPGGSLVEYVEFHPSTTFRGRSNGYVFQAGPRGVGYYLDTTAQWYAQQMGQRQQQLQGQMQRQHMRHEPAPTQHVEPRHELDELRGLISSGPPSQRQRQPARAPRYVFGPPV